MNMCPNDSLQQHNTEIHQNIQHLEQKPLQKKIYHAFYSIIKDNLRQTEGITLELGSGMGLTRECIPTCICTDIFDNPWIDRIENAYRLSDATESLSNLIMMDVFHHLRYPGNALKEWSRVLKKGGRVVLFEPDMGGLGRLVYGCFHHEPIALKDEIHWNAPSDWDPSEIDYYAAQGNAHRIFGRQQFNGWQSEWKLLKIQRFSFLSYVASGGFSKPQLYPTFCYPAMKLLDRILDLFPSLFSTRVCIVLEKQK